MGDPRAMGAQIRRKLPSLTRLEGKVAAHILARKDIDETTPLREIAQKVFRSAMQALEETFAILDLGAFDRAADYLARAKQRDFYGLGGSAQIAQLTLLDAFVAVARRDRKAADTNLSRAMRAVQSKCRL